MGSENQNTLQTLQILRDPGKSPLIKRYGIKVSHRGNIIKLSTPYDDMRPRFFQRISPILRGMGFTHIPTPEHTYGRFQRGNRGNIVYILIKYLAGGHGGTHSGLQYERRLCQALSQFPGITVRNAGSSHGPDLPIKGLHNRCCNIEVKTDTSADWGQFSIHYDIGSGTWKPSPTKGYLTKSDIFRPIADTLLPQVTPLTELARTLIAIEYNNHTGKCTTPEDIFRIKNGVITSVKPNDDGNYLRKLISRMLFTGALDLSHVVEPIAIQHYYKIGHTDLIQIKGLGLYVVNEENIVAQTLADCPKYKDLDLKVIARARVKPSGGTNSRSAFNVALKQIGKMKASKYSLDRIEDCSLIADILTRP